MGNGPRSRQVNLFVVASGRHGEGAVRGHAHVHVHPKLRQRRVQVACGGDDSNEAVPEVLFIGGEHLVAHVDAAHARGRELRPHAGG